MILEEVYHFFSTIIFAVFGMHQPYYYIITKIREQCERKNTYWHHLEVHLKLSLIAFPRQMLCVYISLALLFLGYLL